MNGIGMRQKAFMFASMGSFRYRNESKIIQ